MKTPAALLVLVVLPAVSHAAHAKHAIEISDGAIGLFRHADGRVVVAERQADDVMTASEHAQIMGHVQRFVGHVIRLTGAGPDRADVRVTCDPDSSSVTPHARDGLDVCRATFVRLHAAHAGTEP